MKVQKGPSNTRSFSNSTPENGGLSNGIGCTHPRTSRTPKGTANIIVIVDILITFIDSQRDNKKVNVDILIKFIVFVMVAMYNWKYYHWIVVMLNEKWNIQNL